MGKRYSGQRPEDQPMYTNPAQLDFEKRRMFIPIMAGSPSPHPSFVQSWDIRFDAGKVTDDIAADNTRVAFDLGGI